jgi:hypothetical protein
MTTARPRPGPRPSIFSWQRWQPLLHWPWELIPLVFFFAWLYRQTMPPGISSWIVEGWDSAVLQLTGSTWGMPHSPGYPLYTILTNLFVRLAGLLPGLWDTTVVWRVSLFSTVTSLLTLIFVYFIVWKLTRDRAAAILASIILGVSFIFWRAAIMAEVYSFNAFIFAFTYWLALTWDDTPRDWWLAALGLSVGAGLAHHRTALILLPTIALWVLLKTAAETDRGRGWLMVLGLRWFIFFITALIPLLTYLYLPWAAHYRAGQTWLYTNVLDWNTFWFMVTAREWWGLVKWPDSLADGMDELGDLFKQQAGQITALGVMAGLVGLLTTRRYLWLFGPPLLAFTWFGLTYQVTDLDSMLIPLTLTLSIGLGVLIGWTTRWLVNRLKIKGQPIRERWLRVTVHIILSLTVAAVLYLALYPLAEANYQKVDLSGDWQAEDLVEEVVAIARAGTPLTIIGQDNSVLPDFIYANVVLSQPVEALSTTTLSRMPQDASIALLQDRFERGQRVLVDIETINLGFIPWLNQAIKTGRIFLAPTGHPYLWELLSRPMANVLPHKEAWTQIPPGQFLDGRISIIAHNQQIVRKRTGCFLRLTLFWRAETPIEQDYYVAIQPLGGETVLDKNDHLALMRSYLPTSQMRPNEIIRDEVDMLIRQPAALPGVSLVVNLYQVQDSQFPTFGNVTLPVTINPDQCK